MEESIQLARASLAEYLILPGSRDGAFAALDSALEHAGRLERICGQTDGMYTAPLLRLNPIESGGLSGVGIAARLSEDWPWWHVPDCSRVKLEIEVDPRWGDCAGPKLCEKGEKQRDRHSRGASFGFAE